MGFVDTIIDRFAPDPEVYVCPDCGEDMIRDHTEFDHFGASFIVFGCTECDREQPYIPGERR